MALLSTEQLEAEPRKLDLEVTARCVNEVEAVQHMHLTNIPVWFGLLGNIKGSMHSSSGVCVCCLASDSADVSGTMMYRG